MWGVLNQNLRSGAQDPHLTPLREQRREAGCHTPCAYPYCHLPLYMVCFFSRGSFKITSLPLVPCNFTVMHLGVDLFDGVLQRVTEIPDSSTQGVKSCEKYAFVISTDIDSPFIIVVAAVAVLLLGSSCYRQVSNRRQMSPQTSSSWLFWLHTNGMNDSNLSSRPRFSFHLSDMPFNSSNFLNSGDYGFLL